MTRLSLVATGATTNRAKDPNARRSPIPSRPAPITPAQYQVQISHRRRDPIEHGFTQASSTWLVDVDDLPQLPRGLRRLASFAAGDHLGAPGNSLRANIDSFLQENNVASPARIVMLANPRVLGYVFNPLSVFYCYDEGGVLRQTLAEVCNTYGGRHTYLLHADERGRAHTDKAFYVSPFYPVDGRYEMRLPEPGATLTVSVTLYRENNRPFAAVMAGRRTSSKPVRLIGALRTPLATRAVMFGIRRHGIVLYLKGLRPHPRPVVSCPEVTTDKNGPS